MNQLKWKKYHPLSDQNAFICLVDVMGDDSSIVQAARVSYGKDEQETETIGHLDGKEHLNKQDRQLIRYLMNHSHTTPFEMVEFKFMVQAPMDCWRQWIRHRTANVNEYSTRYTEALDFFQVTQPTEWRLQSTSNKQGSSGFLEEYPREMTKYDGTEFGELGYYLDTGFNDHFVEIDPNDFESPGAYLSHKEQVLQNAIREVYQERLALGVAREQARKDLPLSTYTRAYWKCDLHNIFNFLRLRMDSHAQLEIRSFANCMFEIVKQVCPVACEAFEDYVLHAKRFSRMEMEILKETINSFKIPDVNEGEFFVSEHKPDSMTDREWKEFLEKLS